MATALAMMASTNIKYIISDFESAIINFSREQMSPEALNLASVAIQGNGKIYLIWAPTHFGLAGNERAHDAAREITNRAGIDPNPTFANSLPWSGRGRPVSYRDIRNHYRLERDRFPPLHSPITKSEAIHCANSYSNSVTYSYCYPGQHSYKCKDRADLAHVLWACPQVATPVRRITRAKQWETSCSALTQQYKHGPLSQPRTLLEPKLLADA